jgi:hypothetical protein
VRHGHSLDDVKYKYTIDQVNLFYRYAVEEELLTYRIQTISSAKAGALHAQYATKRDAQRAVKGFQDFVDSLDPKKIEQKQKQNEETAKDPRKVFRMLGGLGLIAGTDKL